MEINVWINKMLLVGKMCAGEIYVLTEEKLSFDSLVADFSLYCTFS